MPVPSWTIIWAGYNFTNAFLRIYCTTDVPCILHLYGSFYVARKHLHAKNKRGLLVKGSVKYCHVTWWEVEQEEIGYTLFHTFRITYFVHCQQIRFRFGHALIGLEWSNSSSALYGIHYDTTKPAGEPLWANPFFT